MDQARRFAKPRCRYVLATPYPLRSSPIRATRAHICATTCTLRLLSEVDVVRKAARLDTRSDQRDTHLRSPDFLHVEEFQDVTFYSTSVSGTKEHFMVTGDLTIRGTTRPSRWT